MERTFPLDPRAGGQTHNVTPAISTVMMTCLETLANIVENEGGI